MAKSTLPLAHNTFDTLTKSRGEQRVPDLLNMSPTSVLSGYAGPGVLLDEKGQVVASNTDGHVLAKAFESGGDSTLRGLLAGVILESRAVSEKVEIEVEDGSVTLDIVLVPFGLDEGSRFVLALSRESTTERNLIDALIASRQLFKDLVACSSDFAWETLPDGSFGYVSSKGALGYSAHELNKQNVRQLVHSSQVADAPFPFEGTIPYEDIEVWMRHADGSAACLQVSSVPVFSEDGEWRGARGVARDVTVMREHELALDQAHNRQRLLGDIVDSIRNEVEPRAMLQAAAESATQAMEASHGWIFRSDGQGGYVKAAEYGRGNGPAPDAAIMSALDLIVNGDPRGVIERIAGTSVVLTAVSRHHGVVNGAVSVCREQADAAWTDGDRGLLVGVADCLGIAIEQIVNHETLERISRTDELTGLLNRRAFFEEVDLRLAHHRRTGRAGTLVYVDLDNFKPVNDVHGHQRGDEVLRDLAGMLSMGTRVGDLVARLGGDEFALWLEETIEKDATAKAKELLADSKKLRPLSADEDRPLGISIGMAFSETQGSESIDELVARADRAMYEVKHGGKSGIAIARSRRQKEKASGR